MPEIDIISPESLLKAAMRIAESRGLGLDMWSGPELLLLPKAFWVELADAMNGSERAMAPPIQTLVSLIPLLPKPTGGERPIVLSSTWYVLWSSVRSPRASAFEVDFVKFWDDAVKGSSALRAALMRKLLDEVASFNKETILNMFWDLEKFYDTINFLRLFDLAVDANYPVWLLCYDMMYHVAPRMIRFNGWFSKTTWPMHGVLPGTPRANTFARIVLYPVLEAMHSKLPPILPSFCEHTLRLYVDDLSQCLKTPSDKLIVHASVTAARALYTTLIAAGFKVSPKSAANSNSPKQLQCVLKVLEGENVFIKNQRVVKDLGIDSAAGTMRPASTLRGRLQKAKRKTCRFGLFRRSCASSKLVAARKKSVDWQCPSNNSVWN